MLKAFNNHFGDRSKIKIPKIIPFCNLKSAKIAKICEKIFSASIFEDTKCAKITKITPNERRDQTHSFGVNFVMFWALSTFKN